MALPILPCPEPMHPHQPLCRESDGTLRFKPNAAAVALLEAHPKSLEQLLDDPTFEREEKMQFVQLIGLALEKVRELGLAPDPLPRVRAVPAERARHPFQPLRWDGKGVIRFKPNKLFDYLLDTGPLDLNVLCVRLHGNQADFQQVGQLIGYSHSGAPSYVSNAVLNAAWNEWEAREQRWVVEQTKLQADALDTALPSAEAGSNQKPRL